MKYKFLIVGLLLLFGLTVFGNYVDYVVVSQVEYDCPGAETAHEYVELYNPTNHDIDISGWDIVYKTAAGSTWSIKATLPAGSTIQACGYFLVGGSLISTEWPGVTVDFVEDGIGLSGTGGHVGIRDVSDTVIDYVGWGTAASAEGGSAAPDAGSSTDSIERISGPAGINVNGQGNGWDTDNNGNDWVIINEAPSNSSSPTECPPDATPPQVSLTDPVDTATGVALNKVVTITFDEAMDTGTATIAFAINPLVTGATNITWAGGDTILIFTHTIDFAADTLYTITISTDAEDTSGNALDGDGDGSSGPDYIFSFTTMDATSPDTITDLAASDGPGSKQVTLDWTAVGDDGNVGTATSYILKYSTTNITNDTDFINATTYAQAWTPLIAGSPESQVLTMPDAGQLYYFSIKAVDDSTNESPFGNVDSATSGDSATSVSPNVKAATSGRVTYTFTFSVISPKYDGDDSFRLVVPAAWGTVTAGTTQVLLDGTNFPGFTISGQEITASNITVNNNIQVIVGPITVQSAAQANVAFEMYTNVDGGGFIAVTGSPTVDVSEPATITLNPATDPHHTPGTTDIVTVEIRDSSNEILYGAQIDLVITKNPGGDATLNNSTIYTDLSGTATFNYKLSSTPGENEVTITCNTLTAIYLDTAFAGNYISQNYPNPFNLNRYQNTTFRINLEGNFEVKLLIYNINGILIRTLYDGPMTSGLHEVTWDGTNDHFKQLDSGVYFVYFKYGSNTEKFKMTIVK